MIPTILLYAQLAAVPLPSEATVVITPDVVEVPVDRIFHDFSVANPGPEPREVRLTVLSWTQDDAGRVSLAPAADAAVFPRRAVVLPAQARRFRFWTSGPPAERERAYRISVVVLDGGRPTVNALVPAFVAPLRRLVDPALSLTCDRPRACRVVIANQGTVRIRPARITLVAAGDDAASGGDGLALDPWWVLAGGTRVHEVPLAPRPGGDVVVRVALEGRELVAHADRPGRSEEAR